MYYSQDILKKFPLEMDNTYIVADFDRTITNGDSITSWSILSNTNLLPNTYIKERQQLYDEYRPIEIDTSIPNNVRQEKMKEWFERHIELFIKYRLEEKIVNEVASNVNMMQFRKGTKEFLNFLNNNKIPLIIISAGVGNFIESFLKLNDCNYPNIFICSNMIQFENGIANGVGDNIIHSFNKNEVFLPQRVKDLLSNRKQIVLFGDNISDIKMVEEEKLPNTIKVGFINKDTEDNKAEYIENFDVICSDNDSYIEIQKLLF